VGGNGLAKHPFPKDRMCLQNSIKKRHLVFIYKKQEKSAEIVFFRGTMQGIGAINPYFGRGQSINGLDVSYPVAHWQEGLVFPNANLLEQNRFKPKTPVELNPNTQTSKAKTHHHLTETATEIKNDFGKWAGRLVITKTADNAMDQMLNLPIPQASTWRQQIEGTCKAVYNWGEKYLFPQAVQHQDVYGWKLQHFSPQKYRSQGKNPFLLSTAKEQIAHNLQGFKAAQIIRNELGSVQAVSKRLLIQGNLQTTLDPLANGRGLFHSIGMGFAGAMAFFGLASKTKAEWESQHAREQAGLQNGSTTFINTGTAFAKEGAISLASWEAGTIGYRFAQALLYVLPANPVVKAAIQIAVGTGLGCVFGNIVERIGRIVLNRLPNTEA
jgi:hypothetical protein